MDAATLEREMVPVRLFLIWLPEGKKAVFLWSKISRKFLKVPKRNRNGNFTRMHLWS
jgi:hypothetical protein